MGLFEAVLIVGLILVVFGARKLPLLGSALGKTIKEFKSAAEGNEIDVTEASKVAQIKNQQSKKE